MDLRRIVREKGLKQRWLAQQLKIHEATLCEWLTWPRRIPAYRVPDLAKLIGLSGQQVLDSISENGRDKEVRAELKQRKR